MTRRRKIKTPSRARNREITVRMTPDEFDTIGRAAHARGEPISSYMVQLAMGVCTDLKDTRRGAQDLLVHRNEKRGAYVTT